VRFLPLWYPFDCKLKEIIMKKSLSTILLSLLAISYAADVSPTISLRVGDILNDGLDFGAGAIIGLKMSGVDDVNTGFDASTESTRIYIEKSYGKIGLGTYTAGADAGTPYFTVGTSYSTNNNLSIELEYVANTLANATADALQLSLTVGF